MATQEPTLEELIDGAVYVFEKEANFKISNRKGFAYTILSATAGLAKLCLKYGRALFRNNFVHQADAEGLDNFAKEYDLKLNIERHAHIKIEIRNINNLPTIPISTTFVLGSDKFSSIETQDVENKTSIVNAISQTPGFLKNLKLHAPLEIEEVLDLDQEAKIIEIIDSGLDTETLEDFRKRMLTMIRNHGPTGTQTYYIRNTLKLYGVQEAFVYRGQELAEVAIYPLMDSGNAGLRRGPSEPEKVRILEHLRNPELFIIGDYVTVREFKNIKVKINIFGLSPTSFSIQEQVKNTLKAFVESRRPIQHSLQREKINSLSHLDIYEIIARAGSRNAQITIKVDEKTFQIYVLKAPVGSLDTLNGIYDPPEIATLEEVNFA